MNQKRKPTTKDVLKRSAGLTVEPHNGKTGRQPKGTYIRKDGTTVRQKSIWLEDAFARRWAAYCARHHLQESAFAQAAIEAEMAKREG